MRSTVGVFSIVGGYHDTCGGYLEHCGGCSVPWRDIMLDVGDGLSSVMGYHEYREGFS